MKSKFCTIFLYLFGFDALLGLFRATVTFLGTGISLNVFVRVFAGIFTFAIIILAIIQIVLGFVKKLRWSARIIGMYVILYTIVTPVISFVGVALLMLQGVPTSETNAYLLASPFLNIWAAFVGMVQLGLFFWALKDLSKGHYLEKGKTGNMGLKMED